MSNFGRDLRCDSNQTRITFNLALLADRLEQRHKGVLSPKHVDKLPKIYKSKRDLKSDEW